MRAAVLAGTRRPGAVDLRAHLDLRLDLVRVGLVNVHVIIGLVALVAISRDLVVLERAISRDRTTRRQGAAAKLAEAPVNALHAAAHAAARTQRPVPSTGQAALAALAAEQLAALAALALAALALAAGPLELPRVATLALLELAGEQPGREMREI